MTDADKAQACADAFKPLAVAAVKLHDCVTPPVLSTLSGGQQMSVFNDEQRDYMRSLSLVPPERRCWCGWFVFGECYNCARSHPNETGADRMADVVPSPDAEREEDPERFDADYDGTRK